MKLLYIIQFFIIVFNLVNCEDRVRVYERIPENMVATTVYNFINDNDITNCFSFQESEIQLLLKCWRYNKLVNAEIMIYDDTNKHRLYATSISFVV